MKTFDLAAALEGNKVITRDGRGVTQLVLFDAKLELWPVGGVLDNLVHLFSVNGKSGEDGQIMSSDLFMASSSADAGTNVRQHTTQ
jgi:hypothetical protein